ncbi:MAG: CidA/LrgA family protein [Ketobacter sp.]
MSRDNIMLLGLLTLFFFQMLGYLITNLVALPIPAPVMGLVLLFIYLLIRGQVSDSMVKVTTSLLPLLPLFLIPASAGIVQHGALLEQDGIAIVVAIIVSLVLSLLFIPFVFIFFMRLFRKS